MRNNPLLDLKVEHGKKSESGWSRFINELRALTTNKKVLTSPDVLNQRSTLTETSSGPAIQKN
jgi:hypothetical protein